MNRRRAILAFVFLALLSSFALKRPQSASNAPELTPTTHQHSSGAIAITPDGATLLAVNPDSNSVSIIATDTASVITEIAVGIDPRAVAINALGNLAYVANRGSDSLSVLDVVSNTITIEIPTGDRPVGVALSPDGEHLAIAEFGADLVRLLDPPTLTTRFAIPVADRPHGLAFSPDGCTLLVSHLLSGKVTVINTCPRKFFLPLTLQHPSAGILPDTGTPHFSSLPSFTISTWSNVAPAPAVLIDASGTRAYLPQTMAHGQGLNAQFDTTVFPKVSVVNLMDFSHQTTEHISLPEVDQPVGLPWDAALNSDGDELWVVNAGSNDLSVVDLSNPASPSRAAHIPVGDNPRGIVLSPDGATAYVNNTLAGTVSVIDTAAYTVTSVITTTDIPLPPLLLHGKRLFHSSARPDLARAQWISCNTCHIEGEHDGRTWLLQYLGEVPPGATPMITRTTTSLLGMIETYPLRWSAEWDESADSEFSIRFEQFGTGLIHGGDMNPTLGEPNQGRSYDLDALAAYIDSLLVPSRSQTLTPAQQRGKTIFESPATECATCHPAPLYTDLQVHDVGSADATGEWFGPLIDTPTLRFLYDSAPYLHDGSAATLYDVLTAANLNDQHGITSQLTESELDDLVAYLQVLPYQNHFP
jgi:YVTN family beta-propeller protein